MRVPAEVGAGPLTATGGAAGSAAPPETAPPETVPPETVPPSAAPPSAAASAGPSPRGRVTAHRSLRADATRNRDAILSAARDVFAEHGLQAPLEDIARRAGVGIATLYRRFPTREHLVAAALVEKVSQYADAAREALAQLDPWAGFAGLVTRICELQADDRGLGDLLSMTLPASQEVERLRSTAQADVTELIERAKAAGRLRPDFTAEDLLLLLIANAAVAHVTRPDAPQAWRRFAALMLDGFQYDGDSLPAAPSAGQMAQAMARLATSRGCGTPLPRSL